MFSAPEAPYWVIGTDYTNWAAVYACEDIVSNKFEYGWVLTRSPTPEKQYVRPTQLSLLRSNLC